METNVPKIGAAWHPLSSKEWCYFCATVQLLVGVPASRQMKVPVFTLSLINQRNSRVGVLPSGKKLPVGIVRFLGMIGGTGEGPRALQLSQARGRKIKYGGSVVDNLLEFCGCPVAVALR